MSTEGTHPSPAQRIANIERHISGYRVLETISARNKRFGRIVNKILLN
jgi:hypothetical protein